MRTFGGINFKSMSKKRKKSYVPATPRFITRLPVNRRPFEVVVSDVKGVTLAVVRGRKQADGQGVNWDTLGSAFFVSGKHILTCYHVVNSGKKPHQDGDTYLFIQNRGGGQFQNFQIASVTLEKNLFWDAEKDVALFHVPDVPEIMKSNGAVQAYSALSFAAVKDGREIGVLGYPLSKLTFKERDINKPDLSTFIPRVSKGIINSQVHYADINTGDGFTVKNADVIEVDFLFVPGNSGGPVFDGETGEVVGYVHGFRSIPLKENVLDASIELPEGVSKKYINLEKAVYSMAIKVSNIKEFLLSHKVI